uniref:PKD domain-containing protein n=1 Tax=Caenorhabditis tropicalis TaxID=1561998 RepID=A0A1I7T7M3_9PELO
MRGNSMVIQHLQISFDKSVGSHMPDPSLGYGDNSTGSDVFNVLQKFLSTNQTTLCGSLVYIMTKRFPNDIDISNIIKNLRDNHIFVYIIAEYPSTGGTNPHALFEVASRTNGYCMFMNGLLKSEWWTDAVFWEVYQFVAQKYVVSGKGRIEVPLFKTPDPYPGRGETATLFMTTQDHVPDGDLVSLNYTIASVDGTYSHHSENTSVSFGTGIADHVPLNGVVDYKWTIDYHYSSNEKQVIEVRLYSRYYHDFLPFSD